MLAETLPENEAAPAIVVNGQEITPHIIIGGQVYLSAAQFGQLIGRRERQIRAWRDTGYGPRHFASGRTILYPLAEVQAWLANGGRRPVGRAACRRKLN